MIFVSWSRSLGSAPWSCIKLHCKIFWQIRPWYICRRSPCWRPGRGPCPSPGGVPNRFDPSLCLLGSPATCRENPKQFQILYHLHRILLSTCLQCQIVLVSRCPMISFICVHLREDHWSIVGNQCYEGDRCAENLGLEIGTGYIMKTCTKYTQCLAASCSFCPRPEQILYILSSPYIIGPKIDA